MPFAGLFKHVLTTTVVELVAASGTFLENANACCCVTMQQKHEDLSFTILPVGNTVTLAVTYVRLMYHPD